MFVYWVHPWRAGCSRSPSQAKERDVEKKKEEGLINMRERAKKCACVSENESVRVEGRSNCPSIGIGRPGCRRRVCLSKEPFLARGKVQTPSVPAG